MKSIVALIFLMFSIQVLAMTPAQERCAQKCGTEFQSQCKCPDGRMVGLGGDATCCSDGVVHSANELNRLLGVLTPQIHCSLDQTKLRQNPCPQFIVNLVDEDFGDSDIAGACRDFTPTPPSLRGGNEGYKLEKVFRANPDLLGYIQKGDPIALACVNGSNSPNKHNPKWQSAVATTFYVGKKRLRDGFFSVQQSLSNLDKILGADCNESSNFGKSNEKPLKDISCASHRHVAGSVPKCSALKTNCNDSVDYTDMFKDTAESVHYLKALKRSEANPEFNEEHKKVIQQQVAILENTNPWLKSELFKEKYQEEREKCLRENNGAGEGFCDSKDKHHVCRAAKAQAKSTRDKLKEVLDEYSYALKCFDGIEGGCDSDRVRKALKKAPKFTAFPVPQVPNNMSNDSEQGRLISLKRERGQYANEQLGHMECREQYREDIEKYREVRNELVAGVALTIATAGAGSIAAGGATWVASARVAQQAGRALTMAQRARMVVGGAAQTARYIALGLDAADMVRSVKDAVGKCDETLSHIDKIEKTEKLSCPVAAKYDGSNQINSFSSCMKSEGIWLALSALPFVPAAVSEVMDRRLLKNAKSILGLAEDAHLTRAQRDAVLDFLKASKKGVATGDELLTHLEKFKMAGMSDDMIAQLVKSQAKTKEGLEQIVRTLNAKGFDGYWGNKVARQLGDALVRLEAENYSPEMAKIVSDIRARGKKPVFRAVAGEFDPNFKYQYDGVSWSESAAVALGHGESHALAEAVFQGKTLQDITIVIGEVDPKTGGKAFEGSIGRGTSGADAMEVLLDRAQSSNTAGAFTIKAEDLQKLLDKYPPGTKLSDIADSFEELVAENMHLLRKAEKVEDVAKKAPGSTATQVPKPVEVPNGYNPDFSKRPDSHLISQVLLRGANRAIDGNEVKILQDYLAHGVGNKLDLAEKMILIDKAKKGTLTPDDLKKLAGIIEEVEGDNLRPASKYLLDAATDSSRSADTTSNAITSVSRNSDDFVDSEKRFFSIDDEIYQLEKKLDGVDPSNTTEVRKLKEKIHHLEMEQNGLSAQYSSTYKKAAQEFLESPKKFEGPTPVVEGLDSSKLRNVSDSFNSKEVAQSASKEVESDLLLETVVGVRNNPRMRPEGQLNPLSPQHTGGKCGVGRDLTVETLSRIVGDNKGVKVYRHQAKKLSGGARHAFAVVEFPSGRKYIVDPTVSQFFNSQKLPNSV